MAINKFLNLDTGETTEVGGGLVEITYAELKKLRDESKLNPGTNYVITDYECTTTTQGTISAGHKFDIIVIADSENTLNENARARKHEGDTYFAECNLNAWELKYCLDNDIDRFDWADEVNGKGVIYYMKDEHRNEAPYDFKNICYPFKKGFLYEQWGSSFQFERYPELDTVTGGVNYYAFKSDITPTAWSDNLCYLKEETPSWNSKIYNSGFSDIVSIDCSTKYFVSRLAVPLPIAIASI